MQWTYILYWILPNFWNRKKFINIFCQPQVPLFPIIKVIPQFFIREISSKIALIQRIYKIYKPFFPLGAPLSLCYLLYSLFLSHIWVHALIASPWLCLRRASVNAPKYGSRKEGKISNKEREKEGSTQGKGGLYKNHKFLLSLQSPKCVA